MYGGAQPDNALRCVLKTAGFRIYANFEIFIKPEDTATIVLKDGSYVDLKGGTYLRFEPYYPTSKELIQQTLDNTFDVVAIKELEDAIDRYKQTGDTTAIDLGKLSNDLTAIDLAADELF